MDTLHDIDDVRAAAVDLGPVLRGIADERYFARLGVVADIAPVFLA